MKEEKKPAKKPIFKRWWFWLLAIVIAIGIIPSGGDDGAPDANPTARQPDTAAHSAPAAEPGANLESEPEPAADPGWSVEQKNAMADAKSYLNYSGFSYLELIGQLEYEGYPAETAAWAADNCNADWDEEALESAKSYIEHNDFSYLGLIGQLEYEEFTPEQAQ